MVVGVVVHVPKVVVVANVVGVPEPPNLVTPVYVVPATVCDAAVPDKYTPELATTLAINVFHSVSPTVPVLVLLN